MVSHFATLAMVFLFISHVPGQTTDAQTSDSDDTAGKQWAFSLSAFGYLIPNDQSYGSPTFTADHQWLHLEARYNYEAQQTGSLWVGYNLRVGDKLVLEATPILGAVFGNITGIAPGCELNISYQKVALSSQIEYVFDTSNSRNSFLYSWNELVYSPTNWFHAGLVSQRTRAYHTSLDVERGFSVGLAHKSVDFTTYIFNAGWTDPTVVLALSFKF